MPPLKARKVRFPVTDEFIEVRWRRNDAEEIEDLVDALIDLTLNPPQLEGAAGDWNADEWLSWSQDMKVIAEKLRLRRVLCRR